MVWKKIQNRPWSLQDIRRICWRQQKSQSRSPRKIEDEHDKYILSEVYTNGSLSATFER